MEEQTIPGNPTVVEAGSEFDSYPFPKNLKIAVKQGCYRVFNAENGECEDIEATNAKDALSKTKFQKVGKILYLGFLDKTILTQGDILTEVKDEVQVTEETK